MSLPPPTDKPCRECPWRRKAAPGYLGPHTADEWIEAAHGEGPIACHVTIKGTEETGEGDWAHPLMKQCAGAAQFRRNVLKLPRNPEIARPKEADHETVFSCNSQFLAHHEGDKR